ncbi:MAG: transcriptional repressor LexA [Myxococcota bacterium]|nr:transcriptional repressor LexA [Myxococcota bacterium]
MRQATLQLRRRILTYVQGRIIEGHPPTVREVQSAFGFAAVESARQHLKALVEAGDLLQFKGRSRGYALPEQSAYPRRQVPILGQVQAGALSLALEEPDGFLDLALRRPDEQHFLLRVAGESMTGAGIFPGDLLLVRRSSVARHGAVVVALVDDEATVKRLHLTKTKIKLHPENPNFSDIVVLEDSLRLLGVVVEVHRYLEGEPSYHG